MRVKILRAFPYAANGLDVRMLAADANEEVRDDLIVGLLSEGYIGDADPDAPAAPEKEIPSVETPAEPATAAADAPAADAVAPDVAPVSAKRAVKA